VYFWQYGTVFSVPLRLEEQGMYHHHNHPKLRQRISSLRRNNYHHPIRFSWYGYPHTIAFALIARRKRGETSSHGRIYAAWWSLMMGYVGIDDSVYWFECELSIEKQTKSKMNKRSKKYTEIQTNNLSTYSSKKFKKTNYIRCLVIK